MTGLVSEALQNDSRLMDAEELLICALEEKQEALTDIKPATPEREESYRQTLENYGAIRGGKLWYPYLGSGIGRGCLVELADGSVKYDMICGIGVHYFGHSHPKLVRTCIRSALSDTVMQGHLQQNLDSFELCRLMTDASHFDHCFLTSSGVMANENALKIAFHKRCPASRVLAFKGAFAGRTLAISQISDKPGLRRGLPSNLHVDYIPFFDASRPDESTAYALSSLREILGRYPDAHACMLAELVQGEGGIYPGSTDFFQKIFEVLKEHGILVIADEVQSFGRTPELFAFQYFDLQDFVDIVTFGKLSQVCGTLYNSSLVPAPGLLSQTFTSSTSALAASRTLISELLQGNYFGPQGRIQEVHTRFVEKLSAIGERHPGSISGPFGLGAMFAFQLWDGQFKETDAFSRYLFDKGIIAFMAGGSPSRLRFLIPMGAITDHDIHRVCEILEDAIVSFPRTAACTKHVH